MAFTNFGKLFKYGFCSFLTVSPESVISWQEDCRFPDTWGDQQKINLVAQKSCAETHRTPLLGVVSSLLFPSPSSLGTNSFALELTSLLCRANSSGQGAMREANGADWGTIVLPLHKLQEHLVQKKYQHLFQHHMHPRKLPTDHEAVWVYCNCCCSWPIAGKILQI